MPVYRLNSTIVFPPVEHAEDGILAFGGDLSANRLLLAYESGIFPWYSEDEPIVWWAPDPRFVLFPDKLKISKSMKQLLKKETYQVTTDKDFEAVIQECALLKRKDQLGTWITDEMIDAYLSLYEMGYAHSVEVWNEDKLVGGLYGISLGKSFFGESMFFKESNASKVGFIRLVEFLKEKEFDLIDCQVETSHLVSLGAENIPRIQFMNLLSESLQKPSLIGTWKI